MRVTFCCMLARIQTTNGQSVHVNKLILQHLPLLVNLLVATSGATLSRINPDVAGLVMVSPVNNIMLPSKKVPSVIINALPSMYWTPINMLYAPEMSWIISPELKQAAAAAWGLPLTLSATDMSSASNTRTAAYMAYRGAVSNAFLLILIHRRRRQRYLPCELWIQMFEDYCKHPYLEGLRINF